MPIQWVAVTELEDPRPFLSGAEVVLTTGVRRLEGPVAIAVGAGAWLVADIGYLVAAQFRSGTAWLGTGWLLGLVLVALACGMNRSSTPPTPGTPRRWP